MNYQILCWTVGFIHLFAGTGCIEVSSTMKTWRTRNIN